MREPVPKLTGVPDSETGVQPNWDRDKPKVKIPTVSETEVSKKTVRIKTHKRRN
jgi:hypothetical protein